MKQKHIINRLYSVFCIQSVIFCLESCVCCLWSANGPSTTVEDSLQIRLFLQNKPKVKYVKINISPFITSIYINLDTWLSGKNKPKTKPKQTQTKPNSEMPKMNVNIYYIEDYIKKIAFRPKQNKPKQTQSNPISNPIGRPSSVLRFWMQPKFSNFRPRKSLTSQGNSVEYPFLCSEREYFYEELYGKKRATRAEMAPRGCRWGRSGPNSCENCAYTYGQNQTHIYPARRYR